MHFKLFKQTVSVVIVLLMVLVSVMILIPQIKADATLLIDDNFDDGELAGWTISGSVTASTTQKYSGDYSMRVYSSASTSDYAYRGFTANADIIMAKMHFYVASGTTAHGYYLLTMHASDTVASYAIQIRNGNGLYYTTTTDFDTGVDITLDTWHTLWVNTTTNRASFTIDYDGTTYGPYTTKTTNEPNRCYIGASAMASLTGDVYIDDFSVGHNLDYVAPTGIFSTPILSAFVDVPYTYQVNDSLTSPTYILNGNASFLSINQTTGLISGTPTEVGSYSVQLVVDGTEGTYYQNYTLKCFKNIIANDNAYSEYVGHWEGNNGTQYIAYMGPDNKIYAAKYDGAWSTPVYVGDNRADIVHGIPGIIQDQQGYLHIWYGAHNSQLYYKKSVNPNNISSWETEVVWTTPSSDVTYPWLFERSNGNMVLILRITNNFWYMTESADNGTTWSEYQQIINCETPYPLFFHDVQRDVIWMPMEYYTGTMYKGVYLTKLNLTDRHVYTVDGTDLGTSLTATELSSVLIYDSAATCDGALAVDADGNPGIMMWNDKFRWMQWNGTAWSDQEIVMDAYNRLHAGPVVRWDTVNERFEALIYNNGPVYKLTRIDGAWVNEGIIIDDQDGSGDEFWEVTKRTDYTSSVHVLSNYNTTATYTPYAMDITLYDMSTDEFISSLPIITSDPVLTGQVTVAYSYQVACNSPATAWSISGASFLTINSTGLITGTPSAAGSYTVTVNVTTNYGNTSQTYTLVINAQTFYYVITSNPVTTATEMYAYSYQAICNGTVSTWSLSNNVLEYLNISQSGLISGVFPLNGSGSYSITVQAQTDQGVVNQTYTLNVNDFSWGGVKSVIVVNNGLKVGLSYTLYVPSQTWAIKNITWDFGDNSTDTYGNTSSHTYGKAGSYLVTMRVVSIDDEISSISKTVTVSAIVSGGGGGGGGIYNPGGNDDTDDLNPAAHISYLWLALIGAVITGVAILWKGTPQRTIIIILGIVFIIIAYYLGF